MAKKQVAKSKSKQSISNNDILVEWLTLPSEEKANTDITSFIKSKRVRSVKRINEIANTALSIIPKDIERSEMEFLENHIRLRNNLLAMLHFPMDPEVQIEINELKAELEKLKSYIKAIAQLGIDSEDEEKYVEIASSLQTLIKYMYAAISAKDIRQTLNDLDIAKQRVEFLKQV